MAKFKSTVSAIKKTEGKAGASKSAAKKKIKSSVKSAAKKKIKSSVKSSAKKKAPITEDALGAPGNSLPGIAGAIGAPGATTTAPLSAVPTTIGAAIPFGEAVDVEQQRLRNSPEGANIYGADIGFGVALPGESEFSAVERIKKERGIKSKVKRKKTRK